MTLDLYNFILDRIHEACPETMMLKFGCEYIDHKGDVMIFVRMSANHYYGILKRSMSNVLYSCVKSDAKILGTDPTLADVLRTIETKSNRKRNGDEWMVMSSGELRYVNVLRHEIKRNEATWNLSHDSLSWHRDNQPETIEFLYEILK